MPYQWSRDLTNLTNDATAQNYTAYYNSFAIDQTSIFAFREETFGRAAPGAPAAAAPAVPARAWNAAQPSGQTRRPRPLPQPPVIRRVGFTGIVDLRNGHIHICPLAASRGMARYEGLNRYGLRDLSPIDHYVGQALQTAFGAAAAANLATGMAANPQARFALGRPDSVVGSHRIPGTRPSSQDPRARTFDPSNPALGYWDSAGHQQLVRRLRLPPGECAGFAIEKNGIAMGHHKLLFVSRLNMPHFGARGVSTRLSLAILHSFMQSLP